MIKRQSAILEGPASSRRSDVIKSSRPWKALPMIMQANPV